MRTYIMDLLNIDEPLGIFTNNRTGTKWKNIDDFNMFLNLKSARINAYTLERIIMSGELDSISITSPEIEGIKQNDAFGRLSDSAKLLFLLKF